MPPITLIKPTFAGGEAAPSLRDRVDLQKYSTFARTLKNFLIHPHGGASNRPGLHYIATGKTDGKKIRLIPFSFSTLQTYTIEFGEYYCRFYSSGAPVVVSSATAWSTTRSYAVGDFVSSGAVIYYCIVAHVSGTFATDLSAGKWTAQTIYEVPTPYDEDDLADLNYTQSADVLFLAHKDFSPRQLNRLGATNWTLTAYDYQGGPFQVGNVDVAKSLSLATDTGFYSKLLCHFEGAHGATAYTSDAPNAKVATFVGASLDAAQFVFGSTSLLTALGTYASFADTPDWDIGTGDFSIQGRVRFSEVSTDPQTIIDIGRYDTGVLVRYRTTKDIEVHVKNDAYNFAWTATPSVWHAWEISRSAGILRAFVAGSQIGADTSNTSNIQVAAGVYVGASIHTGGLENLLGWQDELRFSKGIARNTANYTISATAFAADDILLTASGFTMNVASHIGSLWQLKHDIEGQAVTAALTAVGVTSSISCGGTWRLITHGTWTGTIRIEKSIDSGSTWTMLREFSGADDYNANTYGTEDMSDNAEPFLIRINMTAFTSGTCNINLSSDPYLQKGIVKLLTVASDGYTATVDIERAIGSADTTIEWAEGSWNDLRGWPANVEFHPEDRLTWGNTATEPSTYWMTKTSNYYDFSRGNPLVDSDAISMPLPSRQVNGINGFVPLAEMIALTLSNECTIRSDSGPLSPTSVRNKIHGYEGSYGIRPLVIGNRAIYVQSTGSVIRDLGFALVSDSFEGNDLSILSNHLFNGYTIVDMAYQQNPDRIVWAVRSDGVLLSMTYMREQEVIAWTWHNTNDGTDTFESVCTIRGDGYDEVWVSVKRGTKRYIERMDQRMASTDLEDQFFVDCGTKYDSVAATIITGLTYLNGKEVSVLADGDVIANPNDSDLDVITVAGGTISLAVAASVVIVGLPYMSDLETLNIDIATPAGTIQGKRIAVPRAELRLINSMGGKIGPDASTLHALKYADETALYTGPNKITLGMGYADGGRILIRQADPLPLTVSAIVPTLIIGGNVGTT